MLNLVGDILVLQRVFLSKRRNGWPFFTPLFVSINLWLCTMVITGFDSSVSYWTGIGGDVVKEMPSRCHFGSPMRLDRLLLGVCSLVLEYTTAIYKLWVLQSGD